MYAHAHVCVHVPLTLSAISFSYLLTSSNDSPCQSSIQQKSCLRTETECSLSASLCLLFSRGNEIKSYCFSMKSSPTASDLRMLQNSHANNSKEFVLRKQEIRCN